MPQDELKDSVKTSVGWLEVAAYAASPTDVSTKRRGFCFVNTTPYYYNGTSWASLLGGGSATAYDDIGDPDANGSITFAGYTNTWVSTMTSGSFFTISDTGVIAGALGLINLKFTHDGSANGYFIRCYDNVSDLKFSIGADGQTIIAGTASGTSALTLTAGDLTLTSGHIVMTSGNLTLTSGNATLTSGNLVLTSGNATLTSGNLIITSGAIQVNADNQKISLGASGSTDSYIRFDGVGNNLVFYDSTVGAEKTLAQLLSSTITSPTIGGDTTFSDGKITWTDAADEQAGTWTFAGTTVIDIAISSAITTGKSISIVANSLTTGSMIYLESSVAGMGNGYFLRCYDGAADALSIGKYGAIVMAGNAATNVFTITAGHAVLTSGNLTLTAGNLLLTSGTATLTSGSLTLTSGNIDMNEGKIEIDTAVDLTSYIKRNQGTTTGPVFTLWEAAAAADNAVLFIDQDATTAASYGLEIDSEGGTGIHFAAMVAAGIGIHFDVADSFTGRLIYGDLGPWLGTADQGAIELVSDNAATIPAGQLVRLNQQGTGQHAAAIAGSVLYINDTATAPGAGTSYAVSINASSIAALQVVGASQFTGAITVGVDATGYDVKIFGDTTNKFMVWDQSGDRLILADATILQLGGDESTAEFLVSFDGTATLAIDASTANDKIALGATTATDFEFNGATAGYDMTWDSSEDSLVFNVDANLIIPAGAGTHANQKAVAGNMYFETDAKKLWVYDGGTWVGTVLA